MEPKKLLTADYLDIIYDHRNKKYGGYELRQHYDRRVRKAVVLALTGVAALLSFSFISADHGGKPASDHHHGPVILTHIDPPVKPLLPPHVLPPSPPPPTAHDIKTLTDKVPVITHDDDVTFDKQMPQNKDLSNANSGNTTANGDAPTGINPVRANGSGNGHGIDKSGGENSNKPMVFVEQMPQFIGNMNAYLNKNLHYPEAAREAGVEGRVAVEFVVNEDGSISDARVVRSIGGGCDEEALRIIKNMPKWKPGKQNGTPVKVLFVLPIKFELN